MAGAQAERVLRHLHHLLGARAADVSDDRRLLECFLAHRDQEAFAGLVLRHGPAVLGVCRRVLGDMHDAEDVFQATFLVLARRAAAIRKPESLASWLHGVAYRLALKARARAEKRRRHERRAPVPRRVEEPDLSWREVQTLLDEELQRLPEKLRLPLLLCYLEGQTQDEAARRLGWPRGTLKRRLERGREQLRSRLTRRGVTLAAGLFAAALAQGTSAAVPAALAEATVRIALVAPTAEAGAAAQLAGEVLRPMLATRLKIAGLLMLLLGCTAVAVGLAAKPEGPPAALGQPAPQPEQKRKVLRDRYGDALPAGALARLGTIRLRHREMVAAAVLTPDGKIAIAADDEGFLVYWDVATGKEVRRVKAHPSGTCGLAISADGKRLASGSSQEVALWDTTTAKALARWRLANATVMEILFSPDGKTLVLRDGGPTIELWDVPAGKRRHELKGHTGDVACMALAPDGKTLASGSWKDRHVRLWDMATGEEKFRFKAHESDVLSVAFSPDGKVLASSGNIGFRFWGPATGKKLHEPRNPGAIQDLRYFPDGKSLIGRESFTLHVYDAATGKRTRTFKAEPRALARITLSADGKTVATSWGGPHSFDLWDAATGELRHRFVGHRQEITSLAFAADGRTLFSAATIIDPPLRVWDPLTGEPRGQLGTNPNSAQALALSPDGKVLAACGYNDNTVRLWDPATHKEIHVLKGHTGMPWSVSWSANGKTLASSSYYDKTIRIWDAATGKERRIETAQEWISEAALSPDGKVAAVGGYKDGSVRLWDTATGKEVRRLPAGQGLVYTVAFAPDGRTLATSGVSNGMRLWDAATGRLVRQFTETPGFVSQLAFSRDGRALVSGHGDSTVRLWEVATGRLRAQFSGHRGPVGAVTFSRDGRRIASGSTDTTILIWDATGGPRRQAALSAEQLQTLWDDLAGTDAARAHRAAWVLALAPKQSVPFLAGRLRPEAPLDAAQRKQVARLLADLDSEQFTVRQQAEAELEKLGPTVAPLLRRALEAEPKPALEVRRRIETVLEKVAGWSAERLRQLRALEALEQIDTPDARQLLDALAAGDPRAWLTREAKAACQRRSRSAAGGE